MEFSEEWDDLSETLKDDEALTFNVNNGHHLAINHQPQAGSRGERRGLRACLEWLCFELQHIPHPRLRNSDETGESSDRSISVQSIVGEERTLAQIPDMSKTFTSDTGADADKISNSHQAGHSEGIWNALNDIRSTREKAQVRVWKMNQARSMLDQCFTSTRKDREEVHESWKSQERNEIHRCGPPLRFQGQRAIPTTNYPKASRSLCLLMHLNSEKLNGNAMILWQSASRLPLLSQYVTSVAFIAPTGGSS